MKVQLSVAPGTVGANHFMAGVSDYDTGAPVEARRVALRFAYPSRPEIGSTLELARSGSEWAADGTQLSVAGAWTVTVVVQTSATGVEVPFVVQPRAPAQSIDVLAEQGQPTLYTIHLASGGTLQTYVDPARSGAAAVHFTFFTAAGQEMAVSGTSGTAISPDGRSVPLALQRLTPGHVVANVQLTPGRWSFTISAVDARSAAVGGTFEQEVVAR
jgi:hypothetical protein